MCWRVRVPAEGSRFRVECGVFNKMAVYKNTGREIFRKIVPTLGARSRVGEKVSGI